LVDTDGHTALDLAVSHGDAAICDALLAAKERLGQGRSWSVKGHLGWTVLHEAAHRGHADVCRVLLAYGDEKLANAKTDSGESALHLAAGKGATDACEALCSAKSFHELRAKNDENQSAFHLARARQFKDTAAAIHSHAKHKV